MASKAPKPVKLSFKQSLTAKGLAHAELLKRLKALHTELADMDQDLVVVESLNQVAKECISHALLLHKEKGVRAYLACCLVDILRLYAPEAPYDDRQLKDLFQFIFRQFKHLSNSNDPHFTEYYYLLESLSNVKSIVLICDLDATDELMADLFRQCFDVISSNSPKNVQISIADILAQVLDEAASLPSDIVDILLAQFLPKAVSNKPAAHALATEVCQATTDKLQRYVCQYFAEVITAGAAEGGDESDGSSDAGRKKKGSAGELPSSVVTAHALIKELNKAVPLLLLNVIPQLEEELVTERADFRKLATTVLGSMMGEKPGKGDLAAKYPGTWREWLKRSNDKVAAVRVAMAEAMPKIWLEHPELNHDIEVAVQNLLTDPDDKVRVAACSVFDSLDYETASTHVSTSVLASLSERCQDRKGSVRAIAFKSLGRLYELAFNEIESGDEHAVKHFSWIPGAIVSCLAIMDPSVRVAVNSVVLQYIVPLPKKDDDEAQWVDRLLLVLKYLSPKQEKELLSLARLSEKRPGLFDQFIVNCEKNNGGVIDSDAATVKERLKANIKLLATSGRFPDAAKATEDLTKFAKANEKQLYKLIRVLFDPQTDLKLLLKSSKDCIRRLEQISATIVETFTIFLRSVAFFVVNRSSIPTLLKRAPDAAALRVLTAVCRDQPMMLKSHVAQLTNSLAEGTDEELVTTALHALSRLAKADPSAFPDKKLAERASYYAKAGTPRQAKYATTIVALDSSRPGKIDDLVDFLAEGLTDANDEDLVVYLSALNRIARYARDTFENKSEQITTSLLQVLHRGTVPGEIVDDPEIEWVLEEDVDDLTRARILAVKILTNRCIAYAGTDSAEEVSIPVFQLLWPLLQAHSEDSKYTQPVASRLRLTAALSILKLAITEQYNVKIFRHFDVLAHAAQDTCFEVRSAFVGQLLQHLRDNKFKAATGRFNMILFLVAHDPEDEIRDSAASFVRLYHGKLPITHRQALWEHPFVRLLHLLAHHPDFAGEDHDVEAIAGMAKYLQLYIDTIASANNVPYLYHLALKLKTLRDAESDEYDKNLYTLSELSQHLLKQYATAHSWPIPSHPDQVKFPSDILRALAPDVANKVSKTSYLSADIIAALPTASKTTKPRTQKRPRIAKADPKVFTSLPAHEEVKADLANDQPRKSPKVKRAAKKKTPAWKSESEGDSDPPSDFDSGSDVDMQDAPAPAVQKRGAPKDRSNTSPLRKVPARTKK